MPTTSQTFDKQITPLTNEEEEFFARIRSRLEAYFRAFEELEGFSVLGSNLDRLLRKVSLELRCVCYEYHASYLLIEALRAENEALREEMRRQEELCDRVIVVAEATKTRFQAMRADHEQALEQLHAFYATQESLLHKQWTIEADTRWQQEKDALLKEHTTKLELLKLQSEQQLTLTKKQIETANTAQLEYMEAQLHRQITSQVSRDLGKKLARQEKLCETHTNEMRQLQRRVASLQRVVKDQTRREP